MALLNKNSLNVGTETTAVWTETAGLPANSVQTQSIPAGQSVAPATAVDITVLRQTNVILLYDCDSFTMVNKTGGALSSVATADGSGLPTVAVGSHEVSGPTRTRHPIPATAPA